MITIYIYCLQCLVECAHNLAVHGNIKVDEQLWNQLKTARHKNTIRKLVSCKSISVWRKALSSNVICARLLAICATQRQQSDQPIGENIVTNEHEC